MKKAYKITASIVKSLMVLSLTAGLQACGGEEPVSELDRQAGNGGGGSTGTEGQACEVVSGINKGKKGKYDHEGWCMGDWGGTECKDSGGNDNGKCRDAKRTVTRRPVIDAPPSRVAG